MAYTKLGPWTDYAPPALDAATMTHLDEGIAAAHAAAVRQTTATMGDGVATQFTVNHTLDSGLFVRVSVFATADGGPVTSGFTQTRTATAVTLTFSVAPTANQYTVVVEG